MVPWIIVDHEEGVILFSSFSVFDYYYTILFNNINIVDGSPKNHQLLTIVSCYKREDSKRFHLRVCVKLYHFKWVLSIQRL